MDIQKEPIGNTCPDIDKYIKKLKLTLDFITDYKNYEDIDELHNMISECESTIDNAIDDFESIRKDNEKLRNWGQTNYDLLIEIKETKLGDIL